MSSIKQYCPALLLFYVLLTDVGLSRGDDQGFNYMGIGENTSDISTVINDIDEYIHMYNEMVDNDDDDAPYKPEMEIDRAWLTVNSSVNYDIEIWAQSDECYKCDLLYIETVPGDSTWTILVNVTFPTTLKLVRVHPGGSPKQLLCNYHTKFRETGDYWVFIDYTIEEEETSCRLILANDPAPEELPILFVGLGLILLAVIYIFGKRLIVYMRKVSSRRRSSMDINGQDPEGNGSVRMGNNKSHKEGEGTQRKSSEADELKIRARLRSLDTFRGLVITLMIFVNYGGGHFWFFEHATWNGINVADLVFPWFVFAMGASICLSFRSMFKKGWSVPVIAWRVVKRAAKLFVLGFMLGTTHYIADLPKVRVFGVLQRLAFTYLISALVHFCFTRKVDSHQDRRWSSIRDIVLYAPEWLANLVILAIHLGILYGLPVPGCPTGYTGPGGLSESGKFWNCTGGATQYVDALILGHDHMYQWPTPRALYQTTIPFDPEGILGTLNCVFLCFLGIQCGRIFLIFQDYKQRMIRFLFWAIVLGALGALLSKCSQEDGWIPPNKNIWSLSYTMITGSFAYFLIAALYLSVDVFPVWQGQPFIYPGMNSIVIYLCHNIFYKTFPVSWEEEEVHWKLLLQCVWATSLWVILSYWMFIKKIFIVV